MSAPTPEVDADSAGFWAGIAAGELRAVVCSSCGRGSFPPIGSCPHCGSTDVRLVASGGRGAVYSWATVHVALDPAFAPDVPYTIVAVDLDEGGRVLGRLLDADRAPRPGQRATFAVYEREGVLLPGFRLQPQLESEPQQKEQDA